MARTGEWTAHDTSVASGGRYIFSSGSPGDTLSVLFQGTRAEVIYVQHPALGRFGIEIDGILLQEVDSTAPDSVFGARAAVTGLPDGPHTLRVYPLSGTIAIDAFALDQPLALPPTPELAPLPTGSPTLAPPPPDFPTTTPLPATLPFVDTFDTGQGWSASGAWRFEPQAAYRGAGWYADSTQRGTVSILSASAPIDLHGAPYPQLSYWQRAALSPVDVLSVEASADGGVSWAALSQQIGPVSDWTLVALDLTPYRDAVIRLRFRLDTTAALPGGATTLGVWIDELSIQDLPPVPTSPSTSTPWPTITPTGIPTLAPTDAPPVAPTSAPPVVPTSAPAPTVIPTKALEDDQAPPVVPTEAPVEIPKDAATPGEAPPEAAPGM